MLIIANPSTRGFEVIQELPEGIAPLEDGQARRELEDGRVLIGSVEEVERWAKELPIPAREWARADYKAALDDMLKAQAALREYDSIENAASRAARPGPYYEEGCWYFDLRDFTWATSDTMAKSPPAGPPPSTEAFASSILEAFLAGNPMPARVNG